MIGRLGLVLGESLWPSFPSSRTSAPPPPVPAATHLPTLRRISPLCSPLFLDGHRRAGRDAAALAATGRRFLGAFRASVWPRAVRSGDGDVDVLEPASGRFSARVAVGQSPQAAVDRAPAGGSVLLLPGVHALPSTLRLDREVHVFGRGAAELRLAEGVSGDVVQGTAVRATLDGVRIRKVCTLIIAAIRCATMHCAPIIYLCLHPTLALRQGRWIAREQGPHVSSLSVGTRTRIPAPPVHCDSLDPGGEPLTHFHYIIHVFGPSSILSYYTCPPLFPRPPRVAPSSATLASR